jgi:hypothetical protein
LEAVEDLAVEGSETREAGRAAAAVCARRCTIVNHNHIRPHHSQF